MIGIVVFPGSNCDYDCYHVVKNVLKREAVFIWHKEESIKKDVKALILPGGFSYGDYLRVGAIARFSPVIEPIIKFANDGGLVLGICNGFQVLLEAGLLPGVLLRNKYIKYICKNVFLKVEEGAKTPFTRDYKKNQVIKMPIAHGDGNYFVDKKNIKDVNVVFRYCQENGVINDDANPNGSVYNIAGISNKAGNVLGMMPHPERCAEDVLGNTDGLKIFKSIYTGLKEN